MGRFLSVTVFMPIDGRRLESVKALALRESLAGLLKFAAALRNQERSRRVPRPVRRSFALKRALNRPKTAPLNASNLSHRV
jgi:hypothetical protein